MGSSSNGKSVLHEYANLSIDDEEEGGLVIQEIPEDTQIIDYTLCLVGSFVNQKKVNFGAMMDTLSSIWRPVKGVFMEETNTPNVFLFRFFHKLDMQRVMDDGPWTFNQHALLVKRLEDTDQLSSIQLTDLYIWVQVYDLPIGFRSEHILKSVGDYVGTYRASDTKNFQSFSRNYLRIQVAIDVRKPLKSKMRIKKKGGDWLWINFKYERLPSFCFFCGKIGHAERFCELLFDNPDKSEERKFDSTLRAPTRRQQAGGFNQWLRGEDGKSLSMVTPDISEGMGEDGGSSGLREDRWRDLGKTQQENNQIIIKDMTGAKLGGEDSTVLNGDEILGNNDGIIFSKQKRARITDKEEQVHAVGPSIENGPEGDTVMTIQELVVMDQKNLLLAGPAVQARQSL